MIIFPFSFFFLTFSKLIIIPTKKIKNKKEFLKDKSSAETTLIFSTYKIKKKRSNPLEFVKYDRVGYIFSSDSDL